jgi:hypothetical protein
LYNGTHVILKGSSNDGKWLKVLTKDEKTGWVWYGFVIDITKRQDPRLSPKTKVNISVLPEFRNRG